MRKRGLSLLEVLVASFILFLVVAGAMATHVSIRRLSYQNAYYYTALNLAKDILEFGEAGNFTHQFGMKYYYPPASSQTIPDSLACGSTIEGINSTASGYRLKEWRCFCCIEPPNAYPELTPFHSLGDIRAKGLVPKDAPESVRIYWWAQCEDVNLDGRIEVTNSTPQVCKEFVQTVDISWLDASTNRTRNLVVRGVPITKVNDQLKLETAEFKWE